MASAQISTTPDRQHMGPGLSERWPASAIWRADDPAVRRIEMSDIGTAIRRGYRDFAALPSHAVILVVLYPIIGFILARMAFGYQTLHLVFPLAAGFALLGPLAAVGLYELSRQREQGLKPTVADAFDVLHAKSFNSILMLGLVLLAIFAAWIVSAHALYASIFGPAAPQTIADFANTVLFTSNGHELVVKGMAVGFVFALVALMISVFAFPMLLDRNVSVATAVRTSVRAVVENPVTMAAWGLLVATLMLLGSLPLFFGLAFVIPLLGHATWHLYRLTIAP